MKTKCLRGRQAPGHTFNSRRQKRNSLHGGLAKSSVANFGRVSCAALAETTMQLSRILVAIDFSDESKKALGYAGAFARQSKAGITLLHVVEPIACQADFGYGPVNRQIPNQEMLRRAKRRLTILGKSLAGCGLKLATVVRSGVAEREIIRSAQELDIDLIVMGTRGICTSENLPMGRTAERVVREAPCPVMVIRRKEREFVWPRPSR